MSGIFDYYLYLILCLLIERDLEFIYVGFYFVVLVLVRVIKGVGVFGIGGLFGIKDFYC